MGNFQRKIAENEQKKRVVSLRLQALSSPALSRLLICKLAILPLNNMRDHSIPGSNEPVSLGWLLVIKYYWINKPKKKDFEETLISPLDLQYLWFDREEWKKTVWTRSRALQFSEIQV